ncbi:hypothetical protein HDE_02421 [Halotydeus destructor]|nr:hypothetical protein HDE_02421 [Halotydeus destructor]
MSYYTSRYEPYPGDERRHLQPEGRFDPLPSIDNSLRTLRDEMLFQDQPRRGAAGPGNYNSPLTSRYSDLYESRPRNSFTESSRSYGRLNDDPPRYSAAAYETQLRSERPALDIYGDERRSYREDRRPQGFGFSVPQKPKPVARAPAKAEPRQVVHREPKPNITTAKTLSGQIKKVGEFPIIGLKFITEFITEYDDGKSTFFYRCNLCEYSGEARQIMLHILDYNHRSKYIDNFKLEPANDKKDIERRAAAIETVHGRGQWVIEKEKKAYVPPSVVKQAITGSAIAHKNGDVEMKEVPDEPKLLKGEKIVEEIIDDSDDEAFPDPKFFVLSYINDLVSSDFTINSETELEVVDSIITQMRKAVVAFQGKRNEKQLHEQKLLEEATASLPEIEEILQEKPMEQDGGAVAVEEPIKEPVVDAAKVEEKSCRRKSCF